MFAKNALAAVALLASAGAFAQSSVTVYGNIDAAVGSFEDDLTHRISKVESSVLTGTVLGFKGQEDLGGGLKAFFKLENAPAIDTGAVTGNFWSRTSEIGLAGSFGAITAGNSLSLATRANEAQSPFSVFGRMNGLQNVTTAIGLAPTTAPTTAPGVVQNALTYTSLSYSGFSGAVQYGTSEAPGKDSVFALQGNYAAGGLAVGLTYTNNDTDNRTLWQLGGSYDLSTAKVFAQIGQADIDPNNDVDFIQLGASIPVTAAGTVLASWTYSKQDNVEKNHELDLAYDHALSKRTGVYGGLQYVRNNPNVGDSHSGVSLAVGVHHAF